MFAAASSIRFDKRTRLTGGTFGSSFSAWKIKATRDESDLYRALENNPLNNADPTGLRTVKPYEMLPALTGNFTGFNQGGINPLAINASLANLSLTSPRLPSFPTTVDPDFHRQTILNSSRYVESFGPISPAVPAAVPRVTAATGARVARAPSPPSSSLLRPNILTSAGNAFRGAANYVASGIENVTATGNTGFFGTSLAVGGGLAARTVRLAGGTVGGVVDVPGTTYAAISDVGATVDVYNRYGLGAAGARQIGLLQGAEAYFGTDVLTYESVHPVAKLSEASARFGGAAGTGAGIGAGLTRLLTPDAPNISLNILNSEFTPSGTRVLQYLTSQVNQKLAGNLSLAKTVLNPAELDATIVPGVARLQYGRALEKLVAREIADDPLLKSIYRYNRGAGPDFFGTGPLQGQIFDISTPGQVPAHLARPYGQGLNVITYERPAGFP